jgi:hypothetical protein
MLLLLKLLEFVNISLMVINSRFIVVICSAEEDDNAAAADDIIITAD